LILSVTPFYAEGGGQVGDSGILISEVNEKVYITDTKKENGLIVHFVNELPPVLAGNFRAIVDKQRRLDSESNHSATHLLHAEIRQVLGNHIDQKGSLVSPDILRYDVSPFAKITPDEQKQGGDV